jgi:hypothetical protein
MITAIPILSYANRGIYAIIKDWYLRLIRTWPNLNMYFVISKHRCMFYLYNLLMERHDQGIIDKNEKL